MRTFKIRSLGFAILPVLLNGCLPSADNGSSTVPTPVVSLVSPLQNVSSSNTLTLGFSNLLPQAGSRLAVYYDDHCGAQLSSSVNPTGSSAATAQYLLEHGSDRPHRFRLVCHIA